jgi:hypothetical protein
MAVQVRFRLECLPAVLARQRKGVGMLFHLIFIRTFG